jgi:hypothetical protein
VSLSFSIVLQLKNQTPGHLRPGNHLFDIIAKLRNFSESVLQAIKRCSIRNVVIEQRVHCFTNVIVNLITQITKLLLGHCLSPSSLKISKCRTICDPAVYKK